MVDKGEINW